MNPYTRAGQRRRSIPEIVDMLRAGTLTREQAREQAESTLRHGFIISRPSHVTAEKAGQVFDKLVGVLNDFPVEVWPAMLARLLATCVESELRDSGQAPPEPGEVAISTELPDGRFMAYVPGRGGRPS